jgi:prevent-host-death family protein
MSGVEVTVSALRAELAAWLSRAGAGEEVIVTDRGVPVARLLPIDTAPVIERLTREGILTKPTRSGRHAAAGRPRVRSRGSVSELVGEQRR